MIRKRSCLNFTLAALVLSVASQASAIPSLDFLDNMDNSVTLQVVLDANGSVATEISVDGGIDITGVSVLNFGPSDTWETANPGNNPFTGGVTNGLYQDLPNDQIFASFGSGALIAGAYDFLLIEFEGQGTITASGLVAQFGALNSGLSATFSNIPEPASAVMVAFGAIVAATRRRVS